MKYKTFRALLLGGGALLGLGALAGTLTWCGKGAKETVKVEPPAAVSAVAATPEGTAVPAKPVHAATPASSPAGATNLRAFDQDILTRAAQPISGDKVKDAFPGRPYKVNLFQDAGRKRVNRVKIDLDRDDKWDEKWSFEEEGGREIVKRQVAPADDENYSEEYRLVAGSWVKK